LSFFCKHLKEFAINCRKIQSSEQKNKNNKEGNTIAFKRKKLVLPERIGK